MFSAYEYQTFQDATSIKPFYKNDSIPVVVTTDNNFVPYTGVTLYSLIKNATSIHNYDIIVIHDGSLTQSDKRRLFNLSYGYTNISIRFYNIAPLIQNLNLVSRLPHVSKATFYRYFIPDIMPDYEKVIYLDTDIVIRKDISKIIDIDMGNNYLAGCHDIVIMQMITGEPECLDYFKNKLQINNPHDNYVQAGILIFNIPPMKKDNISRKMVEEACKGIYRFSGQDPMNVACRGKIYFLPLTWNFTNFIRTPWSLNHIPSKYRKDFQETSKDPAIIHYASHQKPWNTHSSYLTEAWWEYARETYFYEEIMYKRPDISKKIEQNLVIMRTIAQYTKNKFRYWKSKILSKITFGLKRKKYKQKKRNIKSVLKQTKSFIKNK